MGSGVKVRALLSQAEIFLYPALETFSGGPRWSPKGVYPMLELGFTLFWALRGWGISSKNVKAILAAAFVHYMRPKKAVCRRKRLR